MAWQAIGAALPGLMQAGGSMLAGQGQQAAFGMQSAASEANQVQLIQHQMVSEKIKNDAQIHQIHQETRTKTAEMRQESWINQRKSTDKIHQKVTQLMMS